MRHFAQSLRDKGYQVHYTDYLAEDNAGSLSDEVALRTQQYQCHQVICAFLVNIVSYLTCKPGLSGYPYPLIFVKIRALSHRYRICRLGKRQKTVTYGVFYREMRKKLNSLMTPRANLKGKWNYDAQNRKALPKTLHVPQPTRLHPIPLLMRYCLSKQRVC